MDISRREFLIAAGGLTFAMATSRARRAHAARFTSPDIAAIDRKRILKAANRYLHEQPVTITASSSPRSAGGKHDYFSEGDYWWPDPDNPGGPYIQRDGRSNPDNFNEHRLALIRLSRHVPALAAAWRLTRSKTYAAHAARHLRAWFLEPDTLMNPNLEYAQAIHGRTSGRGIGIIDTLHLVEVARAISVLEPSGQLAPGEYSGVRKWFADYLLWMTTSRKGTEEREAKNNHGTCWAVQAAEFARFAGNAEVTALCRTRFKDVIVPHQIASDGSFPEELRRTKPYGYSIFNLDAMATLCQILSNKEEDLFRFVLADGRGIGRAMAYMFPFLADKNRWTHPHDVEYWNDWPVRQPSLLFVGAALEKPEYISLWRRLDPDPTVPEIVRNYPIRQPLLWISA